LSSQECEQIKQWALNAIDAGVEECDNYLNYRVNKEVRQEGMSAEGKTLIDKFNLDENIFVGKSQRWISTSPRQRFDRWPA
jgi:type I site-specific restriction-modification system R (restriction) subunit